MPGIKTFQLGNSAPHSRQGLKSTPIGPYGPYLCRGPAQKRWVIDFSLSRCPLEDGVYRTKRRDPVADRSLGSWGKEGATEGDGDSATDGACK